MAKTKSMMLALGTRVPDFALPDLTGETVGPSDFAGKKGLLVMLICNHCPYVQLVADELARLAVDYQKKGVAVVGINSNDADAYPADAPDQMRLEAARRGYRFPYLFDQSQAVAKAFQAACTPEFYLFDGKQNLIYRGQLDDARPGNGIPPSGKDLRAALDLLLAGKSQAEDQRPSIGCNVKWRPGNEPTYYGVTRV